MSERVLKVKIDTDNIDHILEEYGLKSTRNNRTIFLNILKQQLEGIAHEEYLKYGKLGLEPMVDGNKELRKDEKWLTKEDLDFMEEIK